MNNDKRVRVYLNYRAETESEDGVILSYVQGMSQKISKPYKRTKILECLKSFWLPIAYEERGGKSQEQLRKIALDCAEQLRLQAQKLEQRYGSQIASSKNMANPTLGTDWDLQPEEETHSSYDVESLMTGLEFKV